MVGAGIYFWHFTSNYCVYMLVRISFSPSRYSILYMLLSIFIRNMFRFGIFIVFYIKITLLTPNYCLKMLVRISFSPSRYTYSLYTSSNFYSIYVSIGIYIVFYIKITLLLSILIILGSFICEKEP